jgi:hypothetical protein
MARTGRPPVDDETKSVRIVLQITPTERKHLEAICKKEQRDLSFILRRELADVLSGKR